MAVQIGAKPDSGFDDPIGMLKDCHRRVQHFADLLARVAAQAEERALTAEERQAVEGGIRYFAESGPRHNADEEDSIFPRIRHVDTLRIGIDRLEAEHGEAAPLHDETARLYMRWIAAGNLSPDDLQRLRSITSRLAALYREHIRIEEEQIFPHAAELLDANALRAVSSEFRRRRA